MNVHSASTESLSRANTSAVFYKAACQISNLRGPRGDFTCCAVRDCGSREIGYEYASLMFGTWGWPTDHVNAAAEVVGWTVKDFRTFMLLMAAEAVK